MPSKVPERPNSRIPVGPAGETGLAEMPSGGARRVGEDATDI